MKLKVFVGYDEREHQAYEVACRSLVETIPVTSQTPLIQPLVTSKLRDSGLLNRTVDRRGHIYDFPSNAPCATDFAISRFLTPILAQTGWALFVDCDVVFTQDINTIFEEVDQSKAVWVVKHNQNPIEATKMDKQVQTKYHRKNWSSVMLFNCDHPANKRLSLWDVNNRPGIDLHQFYWLNDCEIGELSPRWNWLVDVQPKPEKNGIAHFTLGGPWFADREPSEHDQIWNRYANNDHHPASG